MLINILLPYKEKFSKLKASSVSITVSNNLKFSKFRKKVTVFGQFVENPMFSSNFHGIKDTKFFFKSKNTHLATQMCKHLETNRNIKKIIEIHNRPYLINIIKNKIDKKHLISLFLHNDPNEMKGCKTLYQKEEILSKVNKIYCVSKYIKKQFLRGITDNSNKVSVLYNGVTRRVTSFPKKKKSVIFVGRIVKEKGVHLFVEAIDKLYNEFQDWNFSIIGSPKLGENDLDNFSKNILKKFNNIGSRTHVEGFIDQEKLHEIMKKSSIIVIPSIWKEPFGLVAAEAMSYGTAIVASKVGGLPEIIGENGLLISDVNTDKIVENLIFLMSNKHHLEDYQKKSWENFTLNSQKISNSLDNSRLRLLQK